ncbi:MAG TPA: hypothetical protein QGH10_26005, partial [Armatimonadota bacterium]|nr:hypothetical protein [Armatimonadota bacterium]
ANTLWGQTHPDLSYGHSSTMHIPFTTEYLDYLAASIDDALRKTGMDGFMIDWVFNTTGQWLECEQAMYVELMGEPFPGKDAVTDEMMLEFNQKAVDRCWGRIRDTAKAANPDCVIWLTCHDVLNPMVADSDMFREVDWLMNEATDPAVLERVSQVRGEGKQLIQCVVGWGDRHDARAIITGAGDQDFGLYGFAKPRPDSLPLPIEQYRDQPIASFSGNDRNIAVLARHYNDAPLDMVVEQQADGQIVLRPDTANAHGTSPVIADGQIGHWGNAADSVTWLIDVAKPGAFEVELEYACATDFGGSTFEVRVDDEAFRIVSEETGTWRDYRTFALGEATIPDAGRHAVTIQPLTDTPWKAVSVKSITLRPTE